MIFLFNCLLFKNETGNFAQNFKSVWKQAYRQHIGWLMLHNYRYQVKKVKMQK